MEQWAAGNFQDPNPAVTQGANLQALGEIHVAQELIDLDFEQLSGALRDE
jgi:hypothetical protein